MSRDITAAYKDAVMDQVVRPIILITAFFDTETIRFWNGVGQLNFNGNDYTGAGNLIKIDAMTETQKTEARGVRILLSGIPGSLISVALNENYQDRKVTIDLALKDENGNIILNPFQFFSGKADVMEIQDGAETSTIVLSAENDLITLKRVNERRRTSEDQKLKYANDTFFDNIAALQSKEIIWGKGQ